MTSRSKDEALWQVFHKLEIVLQQLENDRLVLSYKAAMELKDFLRNELTSEPEKSQ